MGPIGPLTYGARDGNNLCTESNFAVNRKVARHPRELTGYHEGVTLVKGCRPMASSNNSPLFRRASRALLTVVLGIMVPILPVDADGLTVVGWVERVTLHPGNVTIDAKVDTGAVSCSLHATEINEFDRDGHKWVRFTTIDHKDKRVTLEAQVIGRRKVKRHFGESQKRIVVRLGVCLADVFRGADVNLVDRTGFDYPMLVGRHFMAGRIAVNPAVIFTQEPRCKDIGSIDGPPEPETSIPVEREEHGR